MNLKNAKAVSVNFFLWSGSWNWKPCRLDCDSCWNLYWGPFGIEILKRVKANDDHDSYTDEVHEPHEHEE